MSEKQLDLSTLNIRPYSSDASDCRVNLFECGEPAIDRFLKHKAKKTSIRMEIKTFCAHLGGAPEVIAYYSLLVGSDSVASLGDGDHGYLRNQAAFPAIHLAYLGVHQKWKRMGVGKYILMDALRRIYEISKHAGFFALTLRSINADSTAFYEALGFAKYSEDAQPKMLYPLKNIITLFV